MGNLLNVRQNGRIEEVDNNGSNAYCYPPKSGHYFGSHFIMGGERFETCSPEAYLFGENMDLNFLGSHPTPFPYSAPLPHEPTRTLRALINIRKESLRLIRIPSDSDIKETSETNCETNKESNRYNIEFLFDSDVKCAITVHYFCTEDMTSNGIIYTPKDSSLSSETFHYKRGANQYFSQSSHVLNPSLFTEEELIYRSVDEKGEFDGSAAFPVVVQCVAEEGEEPRQSHTLIAVIERNHENTHSIKPLKQKLFVDGLTYLLQEIYGIENKNALTVSGEPCLPSDDDLEDNSSECVICMSDARDTLILPCRHLCLCNGCADSLRYQANNCPICRSPFRALLQLKAVRKSFVANVNSVANHHQMMSSNSSTDLVDIPPGYEPISLIEALNGPNSHSNALSSYRRISNETETPINIRKYQKNDQKSRKLSQTNATNTEITDSVSVVTTPTARSRVATASPTTPEVVVSGMPVSPEKDIDEHESNAINNEVKDREIWRSRVVLVSNSKPNKQLADDNGSASSSASSGTTENIALQERVRLLSHDKEEDSDYLTERDDKNNEETELSFRINAMSPSMLKDSPGNSSPLSIGISSSSYPMLSLRDGIDEQRAMDADADLLSVATISSANNILIRPEDESSDYFIPFDDKNESNPEIERITNNLKTDLIFDDSESLQV